MRRLLIALAISLLPSIAIAAHGSGRVSHVGGGHMSAAGHMGVGGSGARISGPAFNSRAGVGTARVGSWNGARWNSANWNHGAFHHGRFAHRHNRFFFAGGPGWAGYGYYDCWRWAATPWGLRRIWVCGDYGYYDYY
jgi:hypothetical protein